MAELVKQWADGGSLTATYEGSGDGSAVFSSDEYEGIDRTMPVTFKGGGLSVERIVRQEGIRERFVTADGKVFCILDGGRFGVLKEGGVEPPTMETYTRLIFLESNGEQYINLDYIVQEDDIIEMTFIKPVRTSAYEYLFGSYDGNGQLWSYILSNSTYNSFGSSANVTLSSTRWKNRIRIQRGSVDVEGTTGTLSLDNMPQAPLYLFARNNNGVANGFCTIKTMGCTITKTSGEVVMKLRPCKREADGAIGMIDVVSGKFFENLGKGADFAYSGEAKVTDGYEIIDYVAFDNDKVIDTGVYGNERTSFEILFERTDTSGSDYLFGCSSGNRMTGYLAQSGYWRYGSGYPTFNTNDKILHYAIVTPGKTTIDNTSKTFSVGSAFETNATIPVGGHKPSSNEVIANYQGYIYCFRMQIDDEYVVDFLPCKRLSDGVVGFWDCVTQTFVEPL